MERQREIWLDWMRVCACFLVMLVHSTEPFYLGGPGTLILTETDAWWAAFFDCLARACVPLFVIASAYLLVPVRQSTSEFLKKRFTRILVPFIVWTVVYAFVFGEPVNNFKGLLLNFNYAAGHLWFVYMILGVYLVMPIISPWVERVSKRELQLYLCIWLATTFIPIIRSLAAGPDVPVIFDSLGIPNPAKYPLWGEASWNSYGLFYYLSGFIGYIFMAVYVRKFIGPMSPRRTYSISVPLFLAGFAICFGGFIRRVYESSGGIFPIDGDCGLAAVWETTWFNDTIGVAMMTFSLVLMFRQVKCNGWFYRRAILPVSKASYGMYLCHMLVLCNVSAFIRGAMKTGAEGVWGIWTTPAEILFTALASFIITAAFALAVSRMPKIGKILIG